MRWSLYFYKGREDTGPVFKSKEDAFNYAVHKLATLGIHSICIEYDRDICLADKTLEYGKRQLAHMDYHRTWAEVEIYELVSQFQHRRSFTDAFTSYPQVDKYLDEVESILLKTLKMYDELDDRPYSKKVEHGK